MIITWLILHLLSLYARADLSDKFEEKTIDPQQYYLNELRKVPEKPHEWSEIEITKGIVSLNLNKLDEAKSHFEKALVNDENNFLAMEYLSLICEKQSDLHCSIAWLVKAKHKAPQPRWGAINLQVGHLYFLSNNYPRAETYLHLALREGAHPVHANYLLGYLYYRQEDYYESEKYFHEARRQIFNQNKTPTQINTDQELSQTIHYYLGEIYARLGFQHYAAAELQEAETGSNNKIREASRRIHSEINQSRFHITLGDFIQYDTNVVLLTTRSELPDNISSKTSPANVFATKAGWMTKPLDRWSFGVDGVGYLNWHFNTDLAPYDAFLFGGAGWLTYWNRRDWLISLRYNRNQTLRDRTVFANFQTNHGPQLTFDYLLRQRWRFQASAELIMNTYADDPGSGPLRRNGITWRTGLKASLQSPHARFSPTLGYGFEQNQSLGENWQRNSQILQAELDWRVWDNTHFIGGVGVILSSYPFHTVGRNDTILQGRAAFQQSLSKNWMFLIDAVETSDSSSFSNSSYTRLVTTTGISYTF